MIVIQSYLIAVLMCVITMLCWGSWANTQKLASKKWAFQLFYWDYSLGVLILSLILAFTMGSNGEEGRSFLADLGQADGKAIGSALLGGAVFNIANLLIVVAINIAGMAVAFPIGIGLALVIGVVVNYLAAPLGNPVILFAGVALVVIAIVIDAIAYRKHSGGGMSATTKGIAISILGGILMGFFYRFVAASMATDFANPEVGKLTPYTASVIFALGLLFSNFASIKLDINAETLSPIDNQLEAYEIADQAAGTNFYRAIIETLQQYAGYKMSVPGTYDPNVKRKM